MYKMIVSTLHHGTLLYEEFRRFYQIIMRQYISVYREEIVPVSFERWKKFM